MIMMKKTIDQQTLENTDRWSLTGTLSSTNWLPKKPQNIFQQWMPFQMKRRWSDSEIGNYYEWNEEEPISETTHSRGKNEASHLLARRGWFGRTRPDSKRRKCNLCWKVTLLTDLTPGNNSLWWYGMIRKEKYFLQTSILTYPITSIPRLGSSPPMLALMWLWPTERRMEWCRGEREFESRVRQQGLVHRQM